MTRGSVESNRLRKVATASVFEYFGHRKELKKRKFGADSPGRDFAQHQGADPLAWLAHDNGSAAARGASTDGSGRAGGRRLF